MDTCCHAMAWQAASREQAAATGSPPRLLNAASRPPPPRRPSPGTSRITVSLPLRTTFWRPSRVSCHAWYWYLRRKEGGRGGSRPSSRRCHAWEGERPTLLPAHLNPSLLFWYSSM